MANPMPWNKLQQFFRRVDEYERILAKSLPPASVRKPSDIFIIRRSRSFRSLVNGTFSSIMNRKWSGDRIFVVQDL